MRLSALLVGAFGVSSVEGSCYTKEWVPIEPDKDSGSFSDACKAGWFFGAKKSHVLMDGPVGD